MATEFGGKDQNVRENELSQMPVVLARARFYPETLVYFDF
jgi:hypothetical protein